ncbi:hypothetical protein FS749_006840 [Ceratobasidium sp. UAMH 11750]|nr:hypothetical protein FS749_006840 [Ceratobasidium sp. UAMH 11750]
MSAEEASLGRGKRPMVKTKAFVEHEKLVKNLEAYREKLAHTKQVREQEAALEQQEAALGAAEKLLEKAAKAKEKAKQKAKADPKPTKKSVSTSSNAKSMTGSSKGKVLSQGQLNATQVAADDARWKQLIALLHIRDSLPEEHLKTLDLWELEKIWDQGEGSKPGQGKVGKPKAAAKGKEKAVAKTPAKKLSLSLPKESKVTWLGSPIVALKDTKDQAKCAAASSLVTTRKRSVSPDHSDVGAKHA